MINIFKRELKVNLKSFIIWTSILLILFLVVFLIYPSIITPENVTMLDEMLKIFPEDLLKAFNMDINSINSVFGWLKSEGFVFMLLLTATFSGILGSNIILKEESDKTIEYLNSLPITRNQIVISKVLSGITYIILMILILGIFNYIGLTLSGDFSRKTYLLLALTPLFSGLPVFAICLFISTYFKKTKKTIGLSLGFVFISYFLQMISELSDKAKLLKYFSVFTLADIRNVILNITINPNMIIASLTITVIFIILTFINYNRKELI